MKYCNSLCLTIPHQTIVEVLRKLHAKIRPAIQQSILQHVNTGCDINITLDAWTAGNKLPYLGITARWLNEKYILHDIVLDFVRLQGSHTAENLANVVLVSLEDYGLLNALGCITTDNASANGKMFDVLQS